VTWREEGRGRREIDPAGGPRARTKEEDKEEKGAVDTGPVEKVGKSEEGEDEPVG